MVNLWYIYGTFNCANLQVKWSTDDLDGRLNLYSVSGDGRVTNWTIIKNFLTYSDVFKLNFTRHLNSTGEDCITQYLSDGVTYPFTIFFHLFFCL